MGYIKFECHNCELCSVQNPMINNQKMADIIVVGLSSKIRKYEDEIPLDSRTRSGKVIDCIEDIAKKYGLSLYRTNLVKGVPLDSNKKLRYPNKKELDSCFGYLFNEIRDIKPKVIILLGDIVRQNVSANLGIELSKPTDNSIGIVEYKSFKIIAIYHPSYLLRSKDRRKDCFFMIDNQFSAIINGIS